MKITQMPESEISEEEEEDVTQEDRLLAAGLTKTEIQKARANLDNNFSCTNCACCSAGDVCTRDLDFAKALWPDRYTVCPA